MRNLQVSLGTQIRKSAETAVAEGLKPSVRFQGVYQWLRGETFGSGQPQWSDFVKPGTLSVSDDTVKFHLKPECEGDLGRLEANRDRTIDFTLTDELPAWLRSVRVQRWTTGLEVTLHLNTDGEP
jgi:hypothetical protein